MANNQYHGGFEYWGLAFVKRTETLQGRTNPDKFGNDYPRDYQVDLVTNVVALKHILPGGPRMRFAANDNDEKRTA